MAQVRVVIAVIVGVGGIVKLMSNLLANNRKKRLVPRLEFNQEGGITYVETFGDYVGEQYFPFPPPPPSSSSASVSFLTQIVSPRARWLCRSYTLSFGRACCRCWQFCGMTEWATGSDSFHRGKYCGLLLLRCRLLWPSLQAWDF